MPSAKATIPIRSPPIIGILTMSAIPIIMKRSADEETSKQLEELYGEDYTNLSASEQRLVQSGMSPDSAELLQQIGKDVGRHSFLHDASDTMEAIFGVVGDSVSDAFASVGEWFSQKGEEILHNSLPQNNTPSGGGGGGGGGGTFMYTYENEMMHPFGGRLGASVLNSAWWATQSTPTSDRLNNTLAGLPASIRQGS